MPIEMQHKENTMKYVKQRHKQPFSYVANCQTCGSFFFVRDRTDAKKRKYCNNFCQHGGGSNKVNRVCQQCGKPFSTTLSKIKDGRGKFCSQKCLNKSKELEKVPCPICNTLFTPIKQGNGKRKQYCSKKCSNIGQRKEITLECKNCGKKFLKRPNEAKNGKGQFCSQKCYHRSNKKKIKGKACKFIEWDKVRIIKSLQTQKKSMKYVKQKHNNPWSYISLCQGCGNFFFVRERNEVKKRKYCSKICSNTDHSTSVTKICETCGKEYSVELNRSEESKYCSQKCSHESRYTGEYRTCPICNKNFYVIKSKIKKGEGKFCSKKCASKSLEKKINIKCKNCGKEHNIPPSRIKNSKDYFCDMNCYYQSLPKKIVKNCAYCGEEFLTQPSVNRIFCDKECQQKANKDKKIERICKNCGKPFLAYKHAVDKGFGIYCNNICMYESQSGEGAPSWRGGVSFEPYCYKFNEKFKERVRDFWNRDCAICGKNEEENSQKMSVHHVNYNKMSCCDGTPPLFIPVCQSCHAKTNLNRDWWEHMLTEYIMIWYDGESYLPE